MIPPDPNPSPKSTREPIDQRIVTVRQDLEGIFQGLQTVHDVVVTVHKALLYQNGDQDGDFANVLNRCATNELYEQLLELNEIIIQLGGTSSMSEEVANVA